MSKSLDDDETLVAKKGRHINGQKASHHLRIHVFPPLVYGRQGTDIVTFQNQAVNKIAKLSITVKIVFGTFLPKLCEFDVN